MDTKNYSGIEKEYRIKTWAEIERVIANIGPNTVLRIVDADEPICISKNIPARIVVENSTVHINGKVDGLDICNGSVVTLNLYGGHCTVHDFSKVFSRGNAIIHAYGNSRVYSEGSGRVFANDKSTAWLYDSSVCEMKDESTAFAFDDSYCLLSGDVTVSLHNGSRAEVFAAKSITASGYSMVVLDPDADKDSILIEASDRAQLIIPNKNIEEIFDGDMVEITDKGTVIGYIPAYKRSDGSYICAGNNRPIVFGQVYTNLVFYDKNRVVKRACGAYAVGGALRSAPIVLLRCEAPKCFVRMIDSAYYGEMIASAAIVKEEVSAEAFGPIAKCLA